jgi:hypothetical protein
VDKPESDGRKGSVGVPTLMLLTQSNSTGRPERSLKLLRCPTTSIKEWGLEIGLLPEPRKALEVFPRLAEVTALLALAPKASQYSLTHVMIATADSASLEVGAMVTAASESGGAGSSASPTARRRSTRDFLNASTRISAANFGALQFDDPMWELVLAAGTADSDFGNSVQQPHDIVFLGHADGVVVCWSVVQGTKIASGDEGVGNTWLPLRIFPCGSAEVTIIVPENDSGVLAILSPSTRFMNLPLAAEPLTTSPRMLQAEELSDLIVFDKNSRHLRMATALAVSRLFWMRAFSL